MRSTSTGITITRRQRQYSWRRRNPRVEIAEAEAWPVVDLSVAAFQSPGCDLDAALPGRPSFSTKLASVGDGLADSAPGMALAPSVRLIVLLRSHSRWARYSTIFIARRRLFDLALSNCPLGLCTAFVVGTRRQPVPTSSARKFGARCRSDQADAMPSTKPAPRARHHVDFPPPRPGTRKNVAAMRLPVVSRIAATGSMRWDGRRQTAC